MRYSNIVHQTHYMYVQCTTIFNVLRDTYVEHEKTKFINIITKPHNTTPNTPTTFFLPFYCLLTSRLPFLRNCTENVATLSFRVMIITNFILSVQDDLSL